MKTNTAVLFSNRDIDGFSHCELDGDENVQNMSIITKSKKLKKLFKHPPQHRNELCKNYVYQFHSPRRRRKAKSEGVS
jgi:hypothetical protein